ncbi:MAG: glycosyltransferase [Pseudomonadota bacterium]
MRIGWFSPVSTQTGIATYTQGVLDEMRALFPRDDVDVTVYHPPTTDRVLKMPYPTIELSPALLRSDFHALFDVAVYHLGNNEKNHKEIYDALLVHPGIVVMHDYVYQHYLAGKTVRDGFVGPGYGNLAFDLGGPEAFRFVNAGQVLRCDHGQVVYVPWESDWSVQVPFCDVLARLGTGAVVHSDYARQGLGADYPGTVTRLFMPRPTVPEALERPIQTAPGVPIHLVFCGHIGSTKGLSLLTAAFRQDARLRDAFRVTVAGFASDPDFLSEFQEELRENNLQTVFDLRIGLGKKDFEAVLASADVFFNLRFPNTEGASLSLAEQLAFGRPIIAYPTGCFAEIPEDAAYFLNRIGDDAELAEVLLRIDRERDDLSKRGAAARAAVADQTPGRYAQDLVTELRGHLPTMSRRAALARARRDGKDLPPVPDSDTEWMEAFVQSRRLITGLFDGRPHLPSTFFEADAEDKGRVLALNILSSRISDAQCRKLGTFIHQLDLLDAYDVIGRLISLSTLANRQTPLVASYLNRLCVPDFDVTLWEVIAMLGPMCAVPIALQALDIAVDNPEQLVFEARQKGFRHVILRLMEEQTSYPLTATDIAPLVAFLSRVETSNVLKLKPVVPGTNLLPDMRDGDQMTLRTGCHSVEESGLWTRDASATIYFHMAKDHPAEEVSGVSSLFAPGILKDTDVTYALCDEVTGKTWKTTVTHEVQSSESDAGARPAVKQNVPWHIETDGVSGPLRLTVSIDRTSVPSKFDPLIPDQRELGVLLQSLSVR